MVICEHCGAQRDDDEMGECACALDGVGTGGRGIFKQPQRFPNSMRAMVARKLERQRQDKT